MLSKFKIGHYTNIQAGTGCTVIIAPAGTVASASVRGASPGTRETALLAPDKKISQIHALLLTGGSAFGLGCAQGIMEELAAQNIGYYTEYGVVPIVPAAVIFDKNVGDSNSYPTIENAKEALKNAKYDNRVQGNIGAGTGASVGKWMGLKSAMKAGIGIAEITKDNLKVTVLSVVNAAGDILNRSGQILAGAISPEDRFYAESNPLQRWDKAQIGLAENTVLCAVMVNARLTKQQAYFIAERVHYGIARRVDPSHTSFDGDVSFVMASPEFDCNIDLLASLVINAVEDSIINGVRYAKTLFGLKSVEDLRRS